MPEFKDLRKKVHRRRIEVMLLAGYAVAVTCALIISLFNKETPPQHKDIEVAENYDFGSNILTPAFEDSTVNNPFEKAYSGVYAISLVSDNPQLQQKLILAQNELKEVVMPGAPKPKKRMQYGSMDGLYQKERHVIMVETGDTFIGLLNKQGLDSKNSTEAYNVLRKVYDARNLRVGQYLILTGVFNVQSHDLYSFRWNWVRHETILLCIFEYIHPVLQEHVLFPDHRNGFLYLCSDRRSSPFLS